ncbi:hypothetical protein B1B05_05985 [Domibacillus enclensis]|uniref:Uncharacterized conserved protein YgbK, DUF1537 family n=1 Tax=Domibacillus enclensis TaxID=1017273 RepID=A0A1N6SGB6_9BACI|nr:hypothetical protein B1B05_05985 [Domibacillus enclensis]SIQ40100.1 Uncharacterized conserved protein YgbK, DUF1537 family [Domibacillus enclensis]
MSRLIIIADDLTGANDTGVQFSKKGFRTLSLLKAERMEKQNEADIVVMNAETRSLNAEEAFRKIKKVSEYLTVYPFPHVYKKIDSTLRGNIGAEIDALLDSNLFDVAIVLPAYPKNGRVTIGGYHIVNNCLLEDSEIAKDPKSPVAESHIPTLIGSQSSRKIGHIDINQIRKNQIVEQIEISLQQNEQIIVCDGFLQSDLTTVTNSVVKSGLSVLWVGSAGLAESFAGTFEQKPSYIQGKLNRKAKEILPVLTIAGSVSAVTRGQIQSLASQDRVQIVVAEPLNLVNNELREKEIKRIIVEIIDVLKKGYAPVLTTNDSEETRQQLQKWNGKNGMEIGNMIAVSLGQIAASVIAAYDVSGLILTGGDIAYRTFEQLGVESLRIVDEVEEGIPFCEIADGILKGLPVVTKAGAFGNPHSLVNAMNKMKDLL